MCSFVSALAASSRSANPFERSVPGAILMQQHLRGSLDALVVLPHTPPPPPPPPPSLSCSNFSNGDPDGAGCIWAAAIDKPLSPVTPSPPICAFSSLCFSPPSSYHREARELMEPILVKKLRKLLMMSMDCQVPLGKVDLIEMELGLPRDYRRRLIPKYPNFFSVRSINGVDYLCLESWDSSLAMTSREEILDLGGAELPPKKLPRDGNYPAYYSPSLLVRNSELTEVSRTEFMTPSAFIFLYENHLFLTFRNRTVDVWNFKGELDCLNWRIENEIENILSLLTMISTVDDLNYPEKTETYYIVNAPYIFSACWKVVRPLLQERTRRKIQVLQGCGRDELLKVIDYSSLPHFCRREGSGSSRHSVLGTDDCFSLDHHFHQELYSYIKEQARSTEPVAPISQGSFHVDVPEPDPEGTKIAHTIECELHKIGGRNGINHSMNGLTVSDN